jgi:hypothetical protein
MIIATRGSDPAVVQGFSSLGIWETATVTVASLRMTGARVVVVVELEETVDGGTVVADDPNATGAAKIPAASARVAARSA